MLERTEMLSSGFVVAAAFAFFGASIPSRADPLCPQLDFNVYGAQPGPSVGPSIDRQFALWQSCNDSS